ncbi:MAG: 3-keto-5-aminohexanoate cleavage protein [Sedimentibacter sp.]
MAKSVIASGTTDVKKLRRKTIITAALQGASGSKEANPNTPITPEELAEDAYNCWKAGAAIVHLHMKKDDGISPSMEAEKFKKTRELIEAKCDLIVNMTTSGELIPVQDCITLGSFDINDPVRTNVIKLKPEIASFDVATMNFGRTVFLNSIPFLEKMANDMNEFGVKPEVECFDIGDIRAAEALIKSGHLKAPVHFQLCLGIAGGCAATVENLEYMSRLIPAGSTWGAFGIGGAHLPIIFTTLALGGHIRVGLEDNLYYEKGVLATNVELVERAAKAIELFGNDIATSDEAREILGLKK